MRRCPQCGHLNDDDSGFCVIDGASLDEATRVAVSLEEPELEIQTQWVPKPIGPARVAGKAPRSGILYGLIGGLVAAVLLLGAYVVLLSRAGSGDGANAASAVTNAAPANAAIVTSNMPNAGANNPMAPANAVPMSVNAPATAASVPANAMSNSQFMSPGADTVRRFERTYRGTVGDNGVSMELRRDGRYLGGRVIPNGRYAEIYVEGYVERDGTFAMDEKSDLGLVTGVYHGRVNGDGTLSGTWSNPDGDKTRPLFLRRQ